ncbi:MAG TPA: hypothetical protein PKC54_05865 [Ferruginibacter sp.]|nr:hypothetical protein [Ferruginibacter sp.]
MKRKINLFLILFSGTISYSAVAQRIQAIDWAINPSYPIPYSYTANHMRLSGKVKKLSEMWKNEYGSDFIMIKYEFSNEGELEKQTYSTNGKEKRVTTYRDTVYAFLPEGITVLEESTHNGETTKTEITFYKKLLASKKLFFAGTTNLSHKAFTKFSHSDKGLLTETDRLDMGIERIKEKYTYNTAGQLIKIEHIAEDKVNKWQELSYVKEGEFLTVTTWYRFNLGRDYKLVDVYDKTGLMIKSTRESDKIEFTYQYTFDKNTNWTKRIQTAKNLETGAETITTKYRTIEYY